MLKRNGNGRLGADGGWLVAKVQDHGHGRTMLCHAVSRLRHALFMSRRVWVLTAKLNNTHAGLVALAAILQDQAAAEDQRIHLIQKAARSIRDDVVDECALSSSVRTVRGFVLAHADRAAAQSKATAETLDRTIDALERMALNLRGE